MKKIRRIITVFCLIIIYAYVINITNFPSKIILKQNSKLNLRLCPLLEVKGITEASVNGKNEYELELNLAGQKVKTSNVTILKNIKLIPVGQVIGLKLYTDGVMIVGITEIEDINGNMKKSVDETQVKEGDRIVEANGIKIDTIQDLKNVIAKNINQIELKIIGENNVQKEVKVSPVKTSENEYKVGLWVKDAATGVGTMTYYNPDTGEFAALGHGIIDPDTDLILDIDSGEITTSSIVSINKAVSGSPGELRGSISNESTIGRIYANTKFGIFGSLEDTKILSNTNELEIALRNEINLGNAEILCSIDGENVEKYDIKINKIYINNDENNKSFEIEIIDEDLINKTGGIIRGLSGSPIIQNGKLIGAVTNVLVSDPCIGYGVFIDLMLSEN